jgi:hypothetical protein
MKLKVVCAWCTKIMEVKEIHCESSKSSVSHGICGPCKDKALEELLNQKPQNKEGR